MTPVTLRANARSNSSFSLRTQRYVYTEIYRNNLLLENELKSHKVISDFYSQAFSPFCSSQAHWENSGSNKLLKSRLETQQSTIYHLPFNPVKQNLVQCFGS